MNYKFISLVNRKSDQSMNKCDDQNKAKVYQTKIKVLRIFLTASLSCAQSAFTELQVLNCLLKDSRQVFIRASYKPTSPVQLESCLNHNWSPVLKLHQFSRGNFATTTPLAIHVSQFSVGKQSKENICREFPCSRKILENALLRISYRRSRVVTAELRILHIHLRSPQEN
ncbi:CLUMA_CG002278, isoform A [Clunio marinus]|uniref:CLUMA_CG002278, isoform A n=1 Tax=Clunio marinus TaxID=568069 RepID=A0A1J1HKG0_9DIPT|nr:CLUMA_CG002278, isoform A [Clunio marinus]